MLSGAWCTTDANTILNAFIRYAGLRRSGLSPNAAWRAIGLVFGDDSAALDIQPLFFFQNARRPTEHVEDICRELGLVIEFVRRPGRFSFLARHYEMDNNGHVAGTIVDISRMLGKLTFMPRPGATAADFQSKFSSI